MNNEQIKILPEQAQRISQALQKDGVSQAEISRIISGSYETYNTQADLELAFGGLKKYGDILEKLADGYTMEELSQQGISGEKINAFEDMISRRNLTVDNAKAIYQYSIGSNMILNVKRGTSKEVIQEQIMKELEESLKCRGIYDSDIKKMKQYVKDVDYSFTLHENYDMANEYMKQHSLQDNGHVSVRRAIQSMDRCHHIDETILALDEGLGNTHLSKSMKLYRAVKSSYLEQGLKDGENLTSLVGKSISNEGQMSTSPLYDSSFAFLDECDAVFEIYTPKGSRGSYIAELSAYDITEQEVLLNPSDLYITDVQTGVVDKNGRSKNVLKALCLSKDRECYREIERESNKPEQESAITSSNLLVKQNRFSKFFSKLKAKFAGNKTVNRSTESQYESQQNNDSLIENTLKDKLKGQVKSPVVQGATEISKSSQRLVISEDGKEL